MQMNSPNKTVQFTIVIYFNNILTFQTLNSTKSQTLYTKNYSFNTDYRIQCRKEINH